MVVFLLLLFVLVALALLTLQRQRRLARARRREELPRARTLFDLRLGDIVQAETRDWAVEQRLLYDQEGFQWLEYLLRDGEDTRWLVVCEDDFLEVSWLETIQLEPPPTWPLPAQISWQGVRYSLQEQGSAEVTASHRALNRQPGRCRFADYGAPDGLVLGLEIWGEPPDAMELEATAGRRIAPHSLSLLPGDGRSIYRPD